MSRRSNRWGVRSVAMMSVIGLLLAACGSDSKPSAAGSSSQSETVKIGGILKIGAFNLASSMDPILGAEDNGCCGGIEQTALYDQLMSYDEATGKYVPVTAESLTPNADFSVWTLKLRSGIKFSDGTAYDSAAIKFNYDRFVAPDSKAQSKANVTANVKSVDVVDPLTVQYTLTSPWAGFPALLTITPGRIVSPTAAQAPGANLMTNPVGAGAGPFIFDSFKPNESISLKRNPNYWGGPVPLDGIQMVPYSTGPTTFAALQAGEIQGMEVQDAISGSSVKAAGLQTFAHKWDQAQVVLNSAVAPTNDPLVRRAIQEAIDPEVFNQRVFNGTAIASSNVFPPGFPFDPGVDGLKFDQADAKSLVTQAKAKGWDGSLNLVSASDPSHSTEGQTVKAMLEAVGMTVTSDSSKDLSAVITQVLVNHDFQAVGGGLGVTWFPDGNLTYLFIGANTVQGDGTKPGRYGFTSTAMAGALAKLRIAGTKDAQLAAFKEVAEVWKAEVPAAVCVSSLDSVAFANNVHDVVGMNDGNVNLSKAWLS